MLWAKVELISAKLILGSMTFLGLLSSPSKRFAESKNTSIHLVTKALVVNKRVCQREVKWSEVQPYTITLIKESVNKKSAISLVE